MTPALALVAALAWATPLLLALAWLLSWLTPPDVCDCGEMCGRCGRVRR